MLLAGAKKDYYVLRVVYKKKRDIKKAVELLAEDEGIKCEVQEAYTSYLFLKCQFDINFFERIKNLEGVIGFITFGSKPVKTGLDVEKLSKPSTKTKKPFNIGDKVFVKKGIFSDNYGIIEEILPDDKAVVGVLFLGRVVPMQFSVNDIEL